jgi:DNA replication protein DnaC
MDGKILALAREKLAAIRQQNAAESARRRAEVYRRAPEVRRIDARLREIMVEVFGAAVGEKADLPALERESLALQARRGDVLTGMSLPADYLAEIHTCPKCGDTGAVMGKMCSCLEALYAQAAAESLSELTAAGDGRFERFDPSLYDEGFDARLGASPRQVMTKVRDACRTYAENFAPGALNLLLCGGPGLGKTFLAGCIARSVAARGYSVVYVSAGAAVEAFEEKKFARDDGDAAALVDRMLTGDLLILDDLGTEMGGSFASGAIYALLNSRRTRRGSMIFCTALSPEELRRRYLPQIASRIEGEFKALEFVGRDIRTKKRGR